MWLHQMSRIVNDGPAHDVSISLLEKQNGNNEVPLFLRVDLMHTSRWRQSHRYTNGSTEEDTNTTRTSVWTKTVHNWIRRKAGERESLRTLEIGAKKWCKDHVIRTKSIRAPIYWHKTDRYSSDNQTLHWECHSSRKRDQTHQD